MRKLTVLISVFTVALSWATLSQAAPAGHSSHEAKAGVTKAGVSAETTVAATPAWENLKPIVGTWIEGTPSTVIDGTTLGGMVWLQLDYTLPEEWKVGMLNRVSFVYTDPLNVQWARLRLFAEKKGFVDTGSVANKFTLRVEPRTKSEADGKIVDAYSRFDFIFPIQGALSLKLREEPRFDFNEHGNNIDLKTQAVAIDEVSGKATPTSFFYNGVELGPVVALGPLLWNPNLVNWQRINNGGSTNAGFGFDSYLEYGLTENLAVDLYARYETPYTTGLAVASELGWSLEVYYSF